MKSTAGPIWDLWDSGGPFIGPNRSHGRVTVELGWSLGTSSGPVGSWPAAKLPIRWFQRADRSQVETEVPNVKTIHITRSLDTDAATCDLAIFNQQMTPAQLAELGNPGYFSPNRGSTADATTRWGHTPNDWASVLTPNALLRTYEGYGGYNLDGSRMSIADAVAGGYLTQTGVWLIDSVQLDTTGMLAIKCRDPVKLLIEQPVYPPLVRSLNDGGVYPLHYSRFYYRVIDTPNIDYGTTAGNVKLILGIEADAGSNGYWLVGDDGGVFTYGDNYFFGSLSGDIDHGIIGMARTGTGSGYWLASKAGDVFAFGDAPNYGFHAPGPGHEMVAIETADNDGYYLCDDAGEVYTFGFAVFHGGSPIGATAIVGMAVLPDGSGYWLLDDIGQVYTFGAAVFYGNGDPYIASPYTAIVATPTGLGYYLVTEKGHVYAKGDAVYAGGTSDIRLNDPISDICVPPGGGGYWLVAKDGGVFTFGGLPFYGSLPGASEDIFPYDGNYFDYVDIVKDLLLWGGFWAYDTVDAGGRPLPFANLEPSGTYATDAQGGIPDSWFDKKPLMDAINSIKEVLGYAAWADADGAFHFETPGWWSVGNVLPDGTKSGFVPDVDERVQLISYGTAIDDSSARDRVIITNVEPAYTGDQPEGIVSTEVATPDVALLKGQLRPILWAEPSVTDPGAQRIMADLLNQQLLFAQRVGNVTCIANPMFELNDQARIWERITDETNIHYLRGVETNHDIDDGTYTMTLTTHWLPGFDVPGPPRTIGPRGIAAGGIGQDITISVDLPVAGVDTAEALGEPVMA